MSDIVIRLQHGKTLAEARASAERRVSITKRSSSI
jgi:hypothetical protein